MPICITCLIDKPSAEFNAEHVLTRAFAGQGVNWTLNDTVCTTCNSKLSKLESHWTSNAIEALMRTFSGPLGRKKNAGPRSHPIEVDELYLLQIDDPLVYEAGFAFPLDFYFRPQVIATPDGLLSIAANGADGSALQTALNALFASPTVTVLERWSEGSADAFRLTAIAEGPDKKNRVGASQLAHTPTGAWLRAFAPGATVKDMEGRDRALTARLALDDRGRLYFRAASMESVAELLDGFHEPQATRATRIYAPGEQSIRTNIQVKLPVVYRCVLKTGLNLIAHTFGAQTARHVAFDSLRAALFDEKADQAVMRRCTFLPASAWWPSNWGFPKPGDEYQHRMMLELWRGKVRFRLRMFGHLGYVAILADAPPDLASVLSTKRAVVDFMGGGARLVEAWP